MFAENGLRWLHVGSSFLDRLVISLAGYVILFLIAGIIGFLRRRYFSPSYPVETEKEHARRNASAARRMVMWGATLLVLWIILLVAEIVLADTLKLIPPMIVTIAITFFGGVGAVLAGIGVAAKNGYVRLR